MKDNTEAGDALYGYPLQPSLNFSSAYRFDTVDELIRYHQNKFKSVRYCRDGTELSLGLEAEFSSLHAGKPCLLLGSGMSAVALVTEALVNRHKRLVCFGSFYRKTLSLYTSLVEKYGVDFKNYPDAQQYLDSGEASAEDILFVETPSNPFLRITDLQALREANPHALIITDATLQGIQNEKGALACADIVLHSCTKYLSGHNDVIAGLAICQNEALYEKVWNERSMRGGILDNMSAYLLQRSLKTYNLRIQQSLTNTRLALDYLEDHPAIRMIFYPGAYGNSDQAELFKKTHQHGGSVVTFDVAPEVGIYHSIARMQTIKMAPSFGSVDSLIEIPAYMSHYGKNDDELAKLGISKHQVRLSLGIEPFSLVLKDLEALLRH